MEVIAPQLVLFSPVFMRLVAGLRPLRKIRAKVRHQREPAPWISGKKLLVYVRQERTRLHLPCPLYLDKDVVVAGLRETIRESDL